jgi:outer membrane protein OmpA-like peptidoglycan-associated protein
MKKLFRMPRLDGTIHVAAMALGGLLAATITGVMATSAQAQTVNINHFRPAERARDGFAISRPDDQGHLKFGAQLHLEYANDPLVFLGDTSDNDSEQYAVIQDQVVSHLTLSLGLWDRLVIYSGLPINLMMEEEDGSPVNADGFGLGDVYLGARLRLVGEHDDAGALALQVTGTFPTADLADDDQLFSGDDSPMVHPELLMELRASGVRFTGNVGARVREARPLPGMVVDDELTYGLGVTIPIVKDRLDVMGEAWGSTALNGDFGERANSPLEALGGLKYYSAGGFTVGAAGGAGILGGYGAPDFRMMAMVGMGEPLKEEPKEAAPADRDGDGILDDSDQCPDDPEDQDGHEDQDGCPDPDNDKDGVLDVGDGCPLQAEDMDGFEDEDGCPDPDNDQDGALDGDDSCPTEAEDKDGFEDEDGCPDPDNDQDGVLDAEDKCPTAPGNAEDQGCPKSVRMGDGQIIILERVEFATGKDRILKKSHPLLQEVYNTLKVNPQIKRIRIEGHTDDKGSDKTNLKLSQRRARSVMTWMVQAGADPSRIEAYGCGESRPIDTNKTKDGRQANRRVEFHIIEPAGASGPRSSEGCEVVEDLN